MTTEVAITPELRADIERSVRNALAEDVGTGDLTAALVPAGQGARAVVIAREEAVICGVPWFNEVFRQLDRAIRVEWQLGEGDRSQVDQEICEVEGPARPILTGERTALNFLQLLSGTATRTRAYVDAVANTGVVILDTRKTIPGLRRAQKYAVRCGGARNHRVGLFDGILIKENHIVAAGSIAAAVDRARARARGIMLEIEVETLAQVREALAAGADRLLLDNFSQAELAQAVRYRDQTAPAITLEASGGFELNDLRAVAETGIDFVSVGALTKHLVAVDLSMRFRFVQ